MDEIATPLRAYANERGDDIDQLLEAFQDGHQNRQHRQRSGRLVESIPQDDSTRTPQAAQSLEGLSFKYFCRDPVAGAVSRASLGAALFAIGLVLAGTKSEDSFWVIAVAVAGIGGVFLLAFAIGHVLRDALGASFSSALGAAVAGFGMWFVLLAHGLSGDEVDTTALWWSVPFFALAVGALAYLLAHPRYRSYSWKGLLGLGALVGIFVSVFSLGG